MLSKNDCTISEKDYFQIRQDVLQKKAGINNIFHIFYSMLSGITTS